MELWTIGKALQWAVSDFKKRGLEQPRLEAEILLAFALNCPRIELYTGYDRPLNRDELGAYREVITRRRQGEPVAYILGQREFWSLEFEVNPHVLVPRPETETLVEAAIQRLTAGPLLDLCTGTGCVAIAVASERPEITVDAVDISAEACEVARQNAKKHRLDDRICVYQGDLFSPLAENRKYQIITANPPYIFSDELDQLSPEVKEEPRLALDGGPDGLDVIRKILSGAGRFLLPGGWLLIEIDPRQFQPLHQMRKWNIPPIAVADLAGRERVIGWQLSEG